MSRGFEWQLVGAHRVMRTWQLAVVASVVAVQSGSPMQDSVLSLKTGGSVTFANF